MTNTTSLRNLAGVSLAAISLAGLTACGSSSPSSTPSNAGSPMASSHPTKPSMGQRFAQAKVCLQAAKELRAAAPVLTEVTSKKVTPQQALTQLKPVAAKIEALAKANAALPIGASLTKLSTDIAAAQKANLKDPATIKATVKTLSADAAAVLTNCAK